MSVEHHPPAHRPTAGVDWASTEHALAIVGPDGVEVEQMLVEHTAAGLRKLLRCLQQTGVAEVGIERPDGPCGHRICPSRRTTPCDTFQQEAESLRRA